MKSKLILGVALLNFFNVSAMNQEVPDMNQEVSRTELLNNVEPQMNPDENGESDGNETTLLTSEVNGESNPLFYEALARDFRLVLDGYSIDDLLLHYAEEERDMVRLIFDVNNDNCDKFFMRIFGTLFLSIPIAVLLANTDEAELPLTPEPLIGALTVSGGFLLTFLVLDSVTNSTFILGPLKRGLKPIRVAMRRHKVESILGAVLSGIAYGIWQTIEAARPNSAEWSHIISYCIERLSNSTDINVSEPNVSLNDGYGIDGISESTALRHCGMDALLRYFSANCFLAFCTLCNIIISLIIW